MRITFTILFMVYFINCVHCQYDYGFDITSKDVKIRGKVDIDDGNNNVYLGMNAGIVNIADGNVFLGGGAGASSTSAFSNVFIGAGAGLFNDDGSSNVFIGNSVGNKNTNGGQNVYIGESAAVSNQGWANVIIGYQAGSPINGANVFYGNNVLIGNGTGRNSTGSSNVFIGDQAGANASGSNLLYIENTDSNSPLIFGDFLNDKIQINGTMHISEFAKLSPLSNSPVNPEKGTIYYDENDDKVKVWTGAAWENLN